MSAANDPSFAMVANGDLRRRGLLGDVTVRFTGDALDLRGAEGGRLVVPVLKVTKARSACEKGKYGPSWDTWLWLEGEEKPLRLGVLGWRNVAGYVPAMQGFGRAMARSGRADRLETGTSRAGALVLPILIGLLFCAAMMISLFVITNEPWWGRVIVPIIPGGVLVITIVLACRLWPRPAKSVEDYCARVER